MSDNKNMIKCPACGKEMNKIYIHSANCNIDICVDGCGGIFFDNRELKKFDEQHENIDEVLAQYKNKEYIKQDESIDRTCPVCGSVMVKHKFSAKNNVEIDECYYCGAIFLDYGELEALRKEYETEEDRKMAFEQYFEQKHDLSSFKDYKPNNPYEMFNNDIISKNGFHPLYNKNAGKIVEFISKLF